MKLDLEVIPQNPFTDQFTADHPAAEIEECLCRGIKLAKEGNRAEARRLLKLASESEPENETAWMWLASISEYPEELLIFLQNALRINPNNERANEWMKATRLLLARMFVERGIHASQENRRDYASRCFLQALFHDEQNELALLSLASNSDSAEEKTEYLQKVLDINPENETALASLKTLKHELSQQLLKQANFAAISGERGTARKLLNEAMEEAPELEEAWILKAYLADDTDEKINCYEKILALNPENEAAQAGLASLKMLIQKNSEPKFDPETIREIFENNLIEDFPNPEIDAEELVISDEERQPRYAKSAPADFASGSLNQQFSRHSSECPTDELNADFLEEIESRSGFSNVESPGEFQPFAAETRLAFDDAEEAQTDEGEIFAAFDAAENSDKIAAYDSFEAFADFMTEQQQNAGAEEINGSFAVKSSEAENPLSVLTFGTSVESAEFQNEDLPFEAVSGLGSEFNEQLPPVKELPVSRENVNHAESFESTSEISDEEFPAVETSPINTGESTAETNPSEVQAENQFSASESRTESTVQKSLLPNESAACPFCFTLNEPQAFVCSSCRAMLSLSDMEMILSHTEASADVVEMAIEDLEAEKAARELSENELVNLGIAYLNAKNLRKALSCLQSASQMNPNDVVLASKVNFLAIRVSEIEAQESRAEATALRNLTIMVIDDSPTVRKLVAGKLEKCGHTVVSAADGREAMQQLNDVVPDLILLDIMMPEMDGYQVCKLIRNNEPTRQVPVVMISGKDGFFDKVRGRMAGTSGFISKPFGPETLMRTIETYVV